MFAFVAGLLLVAALAAAPGVGSFLHQFQPTLPVVPTASAPARPVEPSASPKAPPASAAPSASATATDPEVATDLLDRYERALVAGRWQTAFDLLAATSPTHQAGFDAYAAERAPYFVSVDGRYSIVDPVPATDWASYGPITAGADRSRAWLIEVDYPALSGNNAGYEQFVVAPDPSGTWRIWPVR